MKKLLSLLSVLTISGTAIQTTIAATPYNENNYLKKYNLKNLNRQKRESNQTLDFLRYLVIYA